MTSENALDDLALYLRETCPECGTPGPQRHLGATGGCGTCAENGPRPVNVPLRHADAGVVAYDMVLPDWPEPAEHWTPFRIAQPPIRFYLHCDWRTSGCYRMAGGAMVHVKPDCRCPR